MSELREKLFLIFLAGILIFMPIKIELTTPFTIGLALIWFWSGDFKKLWQPKWEWHPSYILALIALLFVASTLAHPDEAHIKQLEKRTVFLLFPLVLSTSRYLNAKRIRHALWVFAAAVSMVCIYALIKIIYFRFYHPYIAPIGEGPWVEEYVLMHRPYFGMYALFAIFILYDAIRKKQLKLSLALTGILLNLSMLFLVIPKMALLILGLFAIYLIGRAFYNKKFEIAIVLLLVIAAGFITSYNNNVHFVKRLDKFLQNEQRLTTWSCAKSAMETEEFNLFVGYFSEVEFQEATNACLAERNSRAFNSHNQYFAFLGGYGLIGLLIFAFVIYSLFQNALIRRHELFLLFLGIIILQCLTENILSRQWGIFFFVLFTTLLLRQENTSARA